MKSYEKPALTDFYVSQGGFLIAILPTTSEYSIVCHITSIEAVDDLYPYFGMEEGVRVPITEINNIN